MRDLASTEGITGITINGHAAEVHALTFEVKVLYAAIAVEEVGESTPIVAGIYTDSSLQAARIAARVTKEGVSALLLFPPGTLGLGGQTRPEMAWSHLDVIT